VSGFELKRIERVLRASSILPAGLRLHRSRCCRDTEDEEVAPLGPTHRARENPTDTVAGEARQPGERLGIPNGDGQPINLTKFVERVIEPTLEAKGVAFKTPYAGRRSFATILRELTGASVAGRDALGHVSTATDTEAHYEKTVPEAVLKGMRLLEDAAAKR
jgi:integrase